MKKNVLFLFMLCLLLGGFPVAVSAQTPPEGCIPCEGVEFTVNASEGSVTPAPTAMGTPAATASGQLSPTPVPSGTGSLQAAGVGVPASGVATPLLLITAAAVVFFLVGILLF